MIYFIKSRYTVGKSYFDTVFETKIRFFHSIRNAKELFFFVSFCYYVIFDDWLWDCFGVVALLRILER